MKKFRNENGKLACTMQELKKLNEKEDTEYFKIGKLYYISSRKSIYRLTTIEHGLAKFEGEKDPSYTFLVPIDSIGTFLPNVDVASSGLEIYSLEELRKRAEEYYRLGNWYFFHSTIYELCNMKEKNAQFKVLFEPLSEKDSVIINLPIKDLWKCMPEIPLEEDIMLLL